MYEVTLKGASWWFVFLGSHTDDFEEVLESWNCYYVPNQRCDVSGAVVKHARLVFETQEKATLFLLRWS